MKLEVDYHYKFDQTVHLGKCSLLSSIEFLASVTDLFHCDTITVRNPFDVIASQWHFENPETLSSENNRHTNRVEVGKFGDEHRPRILYFAKAWALHTDYWSVLFPARHSRGMGSLQITIRRL